MQVLDFDKTFNKYGKDMLVIICVLKGLKKNHNIVISSFPTWEGILGGVGPAGQIYVVEKTNLIIRHRKKCKVKHLFKTNKQTWRRALTSTCQQHHVFSSAPALELGLQFPGPGQTSGCPSGPSGVVVWFAISHSRHFRDLFFFLSCLISFLFPYHSDLSPRNNIILRNILSYLLPGFHISMP